MSIRKHIEEADDALRLAIIEALENKRDEQLETMFEALSKVKELILTTPIRAVDNTTSYYRNKAEYNFKLDSPYLDDTVINFPTHVPGGEGEDILDFDYGYSLNEDLISFGDEQETKRHGKDLDNLDGPT
tara:strand:+ start:940 stop:1329 length:390 start_codon:yes stop_codon:yes gene_type:complete